jgi:hypothetical protein
VRALRVTLVLLALLVVAFLATWVTMPANDTEGTVRPPASLFLYGVTSTREGLCLSYGPVVGGAQPCLRHETFKRVDADALRQRVIVSFAAAAAVIVLLGLAFGLGSRSRGEVQDSA